MYIIVAGCRNVGSTLAAELMLQNHDVAVIDCDPQNLQALGSGFNGLTVVGMPMDEDILRDAGAERADALAAVSDDYNMNIMVSQVARELFHIPKVITRIHDPARGRIMEQMGLTTVCTTTLAVDRIRDLLLGAEDRDYLEISGTQVAFRAIKAARRYVGETVQAVENKTVLGTIRNGEFALATQHTLIQADDLLVIAEYTGKEN